MPTCARASAGRAKALMQIVHVGVNRIVIKDKYIRQPCHASQLAWFDVIQLNYSNLLNPVNAG